MNRLLVPLLILLGSLLYSWFWNCTRKPHCSAEIPAVEAVAPPVEVAPGPVDTPAVAMTAEEELLFAPLDVYFETNKSSINRSTEIDNWLSTAKKYLEAHPDKKLSVTGHTDSDGSDSANQSLSASRAEKVKSILVDEGFNAENLETDGKGEAEPIASNDTPEGKAQNRRVSIRLMN